MNDNVIITFLNASEKTQTYGGEALGVPVYEEAGE
jgi:hypothetical protein